MTLRIGSRAKGNPQQSLAEDPPPQELRKTGCGGERLWSCQQRKRSLVQGQPLLLSEFEVSLGSLSPNFKSTEEVPEVRNREHGKETSTSLQQETVWQRGHNALQARSTQRVMWLLDRDFLCVPVSSYQQSK